MNQYCRFWQLSATFSTFAGTFLYCPWLPAIPPYQRYNITVEIRSNKLLALHPSTPIQELERTQQQHPKWCREILGQEGCASASASGACTKRTRTASMARRATRVLAL